MTLRPQVARKLPEEPSVTRAPSPARDWAWLWLAPWLLLTTISLSLHSTNAAIGHYSVALFGFHLINLSGLALTLTALFRRRLPLYLPLVLGGLWAITFFLGANNEMKTYALLPWMTIVSRWALGALVVLVSYRFTRKNGASRAANILLSLGFFAVCFASAEMLLMPFSRGSSETRRFLFRTSVDLNSIPANAIAVVGDSLIWGQGVKDSETMSTKLEERLRRTAHAAPVYNLGQVGTGPEQYLEVVRALPHADRVIIGYCHNDMPERETPILKIRQALVDTSATSPVLKLLVDAVSLQIYPEVHAYERGLVENYDPRHGDFSRRWNLLVQQIDELGRAAREKSTRSPIFILFPLMQDFTHYPLAEVDRELARIATHAGFIVVDPLPELARRFKDGNPYRVTPNDLHFNPAIHDAVAEILVRDWNQYH